MSDITRLLMQDLDAQDAGVGTDSPVTGAKHKLTDVDEHIPAIKKLKLPVSASGEPSDSEVADAVESNDGEMPNAPRATVYPPQQFVRYEGPDGTEYRPVNENYYSTVKEDPEAHEWVEDYFKPGDTMTLKLTKAHNYDGELQTNDRNELQIKILKIFVERNWTVTMKVDLFGQPAVLKLHDRRFAWTARSSDGVGAWTPERDESYAEFLCTEEGAAYMETLPDILQLEYTSDGQAEAHAFLDQVKQCREEAETYRRAERLQREGRIPRLYAEVGFLDNPAFGVLAPYFTSPGLLLEYIPGTRLDELDHANTPNERIRELGERTMRSVLYCGAHGVHDNDVSLANVIVRESDGRPVYFDFGTVDLREEQPYYNNDAEWDGACADQAQVLIEYLEPWMKEKDKDAAFEYDVWEVVDECKEEVEEEDLEAARKQSAKKGKKVKSVHRGTQT